MKNGAIETKLRTRLYIKDWILATFLPWTTGSIGILTLEYSTSLYIANAQKCGGVQTKIIRKSIKGSIEISPVTQDQPITGGNAPAAPPITMLW